MTAWYVKDTWKDNPQRSGRSGEMDNVRQGREFTQASCRVRLRTLQLFFTAR